MLSTFTFPHPCTIVHWLWVACAALCTCQAGRGFKPWRPTPEACAKIADASGHTPAHEHEGLSSIFLYGRIPDFPHSVRKSVKSRIPCAFPTATFIQLQIIAVKPHGHKQNYHWLSMVKTIGYALDCTIGIIRTKDSTVMVIPRDWS